VAFCLNFAPNPQWPWREAICQSAGREQSMRVLLRAPVTDFDETEHPFDHAIAITSGGSEASVRFRCARGTRETLVACHVWQEALRRWQTAIGQFADPSVSISVAECLRRMGAAPKQRRSRSISENDFRAIPGSSSNCRNLRYEGRPRWRGSILEYRPLTRSLPWSGRYGCRIG